LLDSNTWKFNQSSAFSLNPPPSVEQLQCLPEPFSQNKKIQSLATSNQRLFKIDA
jgi:hypothetical protein